MSLLVFTTAGWTTILGTFHNLDHARIWAARARRQLGCAVWIKTEEP